MAAGTDVDRHLEILSVLSLLLGVLVLLAGLAGVLAFGFGMGMGMGMADGLGGMGTGMLGLMAVFGLVVAGLYLATGLGLRKPAPWGRPVGFVASGISLLCFPLGTAYGIYGIYVLTRPGVEEALVGSDPAAG